MQHFFDLNPTELETFCREHDLPRRVSDQLLGWVYQKGVTDPEAMTNLSKAHRSAVAESLRFLTGELAAHQSATDGTQKLLIAWRNEGDALAGETECVMIPSDSRRTACVSSQVGCPVGCTFCASGLGGLERNLSSGRIVEQVFRLTHLQEVGRISNVVFMGMGEPLANFAAVTKAIGTLNAPWGFGIGARKITVSTVGLPAAIRKLVDFDLPITLALSLHAPNDELRRRLIPWAEYSTIAELLDACDEYFQRTGREITLEYLLLRNVNDRLEHAEELARLAGRLRANVNLIRYNEVRGLPFDRPTTDDVRIFQETLRKRRVNVHLRASRGRDIAAACGQLRHQYRTEDSRQADG